MAHAIYLSAAWVLQMDGIENNSHWVRCPLCGGKTKTKIYENTVLLEFPLYCYKCKKEYITSVTKQKSAEAQSLDCYYPAGAHVGIICDKTKILQKGSGSQ